MARTIEERLQAAERSLFRMRVGLCLALAIAAAYGLTASKDAPGDVVARSVRIVNQAGQTAAALTTNGRGAGVLTISDHRGRPVVSAMGDDSLRSLVIYDGRDSTAVLLSERKGKTVFLMNAAASGSFVVINGDRRPFLATTSDEFGEPIWSTPSR